MSKQSPPPEESGESREAQRVSLAIYGVMTVLGVLEASTTKAVVDSTITVTILVLATSTAIVLAHAWSSVVAHRLVHGQFLSRDAMIGELKFAAAFFAPAILAIVVLVVDGAFTDHQSAVRVSQLVLVALLVMVGTTAARTAGVGWTKAIGWGIIDACVGIAIVMLKEVLTIFFH